MLMLVALMERSGDGPPVPAKALHKLTVNASLKRQVVRKSSLHGIFLVENEVLSYRTILHFTDLIVRGT